MVETERRARRAAHNGAAASVPRIQQSIKLSPHARQRLRLAAVFLEREISGMVEEAVTRYLDDMKRERKEQGLPPIPEPARKPDT